MQYKLLDTLNLKKKLLIAKPIELSVLPYSCEQLMVYRRNTSESLGKKS